MQSGGESPDSALPDSAPAGSDLPGPHRAGVFGRAAPSTRACRWATIGDIETLKRCPWSTSDPLLTRYHDEEWGAPVHDDRRHFEFIVLESAQAGLSWLTILRKREGYRKAFFGFDPRKVARFTARDVRRLLGDSGIVRNRAKIQAAVGNARVFLAIQREFGSFDSWLWNWVDGAPIARRRRALRQIPGRTPLSDAIAKELKRRGFRFFGSTIVYAHLQAVGVVDDHLVSCFRRRAQR